jgi:hyperosmotically inducible periplasmic protein
MTTQRIFAGVISIFFVACVLGFVYLNKPQANPGYISYSGDALITQDIKSKFVTDKDAGGTSISIKTLDGEVLLSGFAKNEEEKSAAEGIAHRVRGVKSVKNEVTVRP